MGRLAVCSQICLVVLSSVHSSLHPLVLGSWKEIYNGKIKKCWHKSSCMTQTTLCYKCETLGSHLISLFLWRCKGKEVQTALCRSDCGEACCPTVLTIRQKTVTWILLFLYHRRTWQSLLKLPVPSYLSMITNGAGGIKHGAHILMIKIW